jgi:hypothetical protein
MKSRQRTFFDSYHCRLAALAEMHGIKPATMRVLIEDALRKKIHCATGQEVRKALMKVAKLKINVGEIKFLFSRVLIESSQDGTAGKLDMSPSQDFICVRHSPAEVAEKWKNMKPAVAPPLPSRGKYHVDDPVDVEFLEKAWEHIRFQFDSTVDSMARDYGLPVDVLEGLACDRLIFRRSGVSPCPAEWFVDDINAAKQLANGQGQDQDSPH